MFIISIIILVHSADECVIHTTTYQHIVIRIIRSSMISIRMPVNWIVSHILEPYWYSTPLAFELKSFFRVILSWCDNDSITPLWQNVWCVSALITWIMCYISQWQHRSRFRPGTGTGFCVFGPNRDRRSKFDTDTDTDTDTWRPKPTPETNSFSSFFTENHRFSLIFGVGLANLRKLTPTAEQICVNRHRRL
jgi:hypothetical protein